MILYKIKEPNIFIKCLKSLATAGDELLLRFGNGITTFGKDPAGVFLYYAEFGDSLIEIIEDGKIDVFVSLADLNKILKRFNTVDELTIGYNNSMVMIKIKVDNKRKTFKIRIVDGDLTEGLRENLEKLNLDTVFSINGSDLLDSIRDSEVYSDFLNIKVMNDVVRIWVNSVIGEMESDTILDSPATADNHCSYSNIYLTKILSSMTGTDIIVAFGNNMPIMIHNKISIDSYVKWYLAPRVDQDEDLEDD